MIKLATLGTGLDTRPPRLWIRAGGVLLPILKCALCPACLSIFGSVFAGARLGFVDGESWHVWVVGAALLADVVILTASMRHHGRRGPLAVCALGALLALGGHIVDAGTAVEYTGFALLLATGIWNVVLLRGHRHGSAACCAHGHHQPVTEGPSEEEQRSRQDEQSVVRRSPSIA